MLVHFKEIFSFQKHFVFSHQRQRRGDWCGGVVQQAVRLSLHKVRRGDGHGFQVSSINCQVIKIAANLTKYSYKFVDPFEVICAGYDVSTFQFLLRPRHPPQSDVQEGCGRSVSVQAQQRADDVSHEGKRVRCEVRL